MAKKVKKMYIIRHMENHVGEIIRARNKEEAIEIANEGGRMKGEPIWKLRKFSNKASKSQEKRFASYPDFSWAK